MIGNIIMVIDHFPVNGDLGGLKRSGSGRRRVLAAVVRFRSVPCTAAVRCAGMEKVGKLNRLRAVLPAPAFRNQGIERGEPLAGPG